VMVEALNKLEEAGWGGWNEGKGMSARDLARRLKPFGIIPKVVRIEDKTPRGYELADLQDAFSRYLRDSSATSATKRNTVLYSNGADVADVAHVAHKGVGAHNGQTLTFFPVESATSATAQHRTQNGLPDVADVADDLAADQLDVIYADALLEVEA
jgi:Protein of unknown function (DUF3631)